MDRRLSCLACAAALLLSACLNEADYPSLDKRAIEKLPVADEPAGAPAAANDAPLPSNLQAAVNAAETSNAKFRSDLAVAAKAVAAARATAPDSEAWVDAQQALSRAQASRVPAASALAALDAALTDSQVPASPAFTAAIDRMNALDAEQSAALSALTSGLSSR